MRATERMIRRSGAPPMLFVADVMTPHPAVLDEDDSVRAAARTLLAAGVGGAPVVDAAGHLVGVVSERDLLEKEALTHVRWRGAAEAARRREAVTVGQICTRPARTAAPGDSVHAAARRMIDEQVARLIVVGDGDEIVGIVTRHDVLRALIRDDDELATAVEQVLRARGAGRVAVRIDDGVVTLSGVLSRRSQHGELLGAVERIDGVVHIEDQLRWARDDVALKGPHPHP
jgi:CBS domain-containing protein